MLSWGEDCWVLVVGGKGWAVTFRASLADRKDKKKEGGKLLFPGKDAQVKPVTFQVSSDG